MTQRFDTFLCYLRDVAQIRYIRIMVSEYLAREWLDFGNRSALPPEAFPCYACSFDAAEQA